MPEKIDPESTMFFNKEISFVSNKAIEEARLLRESQTFFRDNFSKELNKEINQLLNDFNNHNHKGYSN